MNKINKVVIPIAGYGTRMFPVTLGVCKAMLPILNKPVIQYILEECVNSGIYHIVLVMSPNQESVKDYLELKNKDVLDKFKDKKEVQDLISLRKKIKIDYVIQEEQKGLGHAILMAKDIIGEEDFGVLLGDNPILINSGIYGIGELYAKYQANRAYYIGVKEVSLDETKNYGVIKYDKEYNNKDTILLLDMIEKPQSNPPSNIASLGRYILGNSIFKYLEEAEIGYGGEIQLTDAIRKAIKKESVYAFILENEILDSGNKVGFVEANVRFALNDKELKEKIKSIK